jgi:hypothetical protein
MHCKHGTRPNVPTRVRLGFSCFQTRGTCRVTVLSVWCSRMSALATAEGTFEAPGPAWEPGIATVCVRFPRVPSGPEGEDGHHARAPQCTRLYHAVQAARAKAFAQ